MSVSLTNTQTRAIAAIRDWYLHRTHEQQVFRVFGYAGVGENDHHRHGHRGARP